MTRSISIPLAEKAIAALKQDATRLSKIVAPEPARLPATARALRDWLADPELLKVPPTVIPHMAVEGRATLLSGREKIGKSTLAACAVAAATRGDDVLGSSLIKPVCCLWYALDEPIGDTVRRFATLGADVDRIAINTEPRSASELLDALERDLKEFPETDLAVVDTLSRVLAMSGVDPNSSREVEPVIAKIVDLFHRENVAAILLYHTGKAGREYRGSTAIGATVDEVLTLRKRGQGEEDDFDDDASDDGRRLLVQDGRNLRGRVQLTYVDGVYRLYEETNPPRIRILDALHDHGSVGSRSELTKLAGVKKADGLHTIANMIAEGAIIENGRNLKLPGSPARSPVPPVSHSREPASRALKFPGSPRFPEGGTTTEPAPEPLLPMGNTPGSHFLRGGVTEAGTTARTQVIERDGQQVRQVLRPTAHGLKWFDEVVA